MNINPINRFFDKVYVINIARNHDRLRVFLQENKDLEVEIFQGVDGTKLFPELETVWEFPMSFFKEFDLDYKSCRRWNKGQLGCAMSNILLQRQIVKEGVKNCLILEDDAQLIRSKLSFFEEAVKEIPEKWELFYLGYKPSSPLYEKHKIGRLLIRIKHLLKPYKKGNGISSCTAKYRFFSKSFSKHLNLPGVYAGTHAYALSNYGAKKIVNLDSPLRYGFDNALMHANYYKLINSYSLKKVLFVQNEFFETSLNN